MSSVPARTAQHQPTSGAPDSRPPQTGTGPHAILGTTEAVAIIVGIVIGAGIFSLPSLVASMSGSAGWMLAAWLFGGLISLIGALCYAELSTAFPNAGGDYHFLRRAYGPQVSFVFAWARFSVITTGSIAVLAFVFGDYMTQALPLGAHSGSIYAAAVVVVLTWVNLRGIKSGAATQTWLTMLEVAGLLAIVVAGLYAAFGGMPAPAPSTAAGGFPGWSAYGLAVVFVLFTFGGWNEAAYISAELKGGQRAMVKALVLSIVVITVLYLLVNWAYLQGLGFEGMAKSRAIAAELVGRAFGPIGEKLFALMVALAALTSINATMIVGARTNFAVGRDWPTLSFLGQWDDARDTPRTALLAQSALALLLVFTGFAVGGGLKSMVEYTAPVFWFFFLLTGLSLFVLRVREPQTPRPFRVPLYPVLPAFFCLVCAYMLWSSLSYVYSQELGGLNAAWIGVGVLAVGVLLLAVVGKPNPNR